MAVVASFAAFAPLSYATRAIAGGDRRARFPSGWPRCTSGRSLGSATTGVGRALARLAMATGPPGGAPVPFALSGVSRSARHPGGRARRLRAGGRSSSGSTRSPAGTASGMRVVDAARSCGIAARWPRLHGRGDLGRVRPVGGARGRRVRRAARRSARARPRGCGTGHDTLTLTTAPSARSWPRRSSASRFFQIFAAALASRARTVDVHRAVGPGASDPSPRFHSGFGD